MPSVNETTSSNYNTSTSAKTLTSDEIGNKMGSGGSYQALNKVGDGVRAAGEEEGGLLSKREVLIITLTSIIAVILIVIAAVIVIIKVTLTTFF